MRHHIPADWALYAAAAWCCLCFALVGLGIYNEYRIDRKAHRMRSNRNV